MHITFNTPYTSLLEDERLRPRPAAEVLPDWRKEVSAIVRTERETGRSVRTCPALQDYLHLGYVIPLWADIQLTRVSIVNGRITPDPNGRGIDWKTPNKLAFRLEGHGADQIKGAEPFQPPVEISHLIKPICPWLVETPPGWSILVLPLTLHEKRKKIPLEPIPGVVNTDFWHQINTPCFWTHIEPEMFLKAGTPFMHVIPFCRDHALEAEFKLIEDDMRLQNLAGALNDFSGGYRKLQKSVDKARHAHTDETE